MEIGFTFKIIDKADINTVIPLVQELNKHSVSDEVIKGRFAEMITRSYECAGVFERDNLIGVCGLWFNTRHYIGKSVEVDHVYIKEEFQGKGLGKNFFKWIYEYAKKKGCNASELNAYV